MNLQSTRIVIAAGGTGGHLFPAQILASQLREYHPGLEMLFAGAHRHQSPFFQQNKYRYFEVKSATPFCGSWFARIQACFKIMHGVLKSFHWLKQEKPRLIVGFGSFHSFPILCAAVLKRTPFILFEANVYPGKVNRWLAPFARSTMLLFESAQTHLNSKTQVVYPLVRHELLPENSYAYFGLNETDPIILVFGGSQGAAQINTCWIKSLPKVRREYGPFQVIHLVGRKESITDIKQAYSEWGIPSCVKAFEPHMRLAYQVASLAICRAGAGTIAELIEFAVPAILIPFPHATEDHQTKNAQFLQQEVKGALCLSEKELKEEGLIAALKIIKQNGQEMKEYLKQYPRKGKALWEVIRDMLTL